MRGKTFDSINVVPFIDIMLVLLTIVLATATFIKTGALQVKLPEVKAAGSAVSGLDIQITKSGEYIINGKAVSQESITVMLSKLDKKENITISADKDSSIQPFAGLMSVLKEGGFAHVSLRTEIIK